jgi:membrane protease YdiL (CAAX protease family)
LRRLWNYLIVEPLARIDAEQREFMARPEARRADVKVILVMITAALVMTAQHYFGGGILYSVAIDLLKKWGKPELAQYIYDWIADPETSEIAVWSYWAIFSFVTYFFVPWFVIVVVFRERLGDYGFKPYGALKDWPIYIVFLCVMWPLLFWVSGHKHFQNTYPFYQLRPGESLWPYFWIWEACYFLQFVGLEFFFRGFMVHGTKHRFGVYCIFVMAVPYCMIHFQKPLLETCGALIAGIVLGYMSLKTRSIWMGAAIHMTVAISMDFLSLWQKGFIRFPWDSLQQKGLL